MSNFISRVYDSIQLHWGIKKIIRKMIAKVSPRIYSLRCTVENMILFTLYTLLNRYLTKRIIDHYGADFRWGDEKAQNIEKKTSNLGYGLFHYAFLRNIRPKRILCVGSMYGFIPYMFARACADNGAGHVDFVDASYDMYNPRGPESHNFGQGFWKKINPKDHFSYLLDNRYISIYTMTLEKFIRIPCHKYDYVFFDGEPRYTGLVRDFRMVWPRIKNGGYFTTHDIYLKQPVSGYQLEFWKFWKDLRSYPEQLELTNFYSGMGVIHKRSATVPRMLLHPRIFSQKKLQTAQS